ncbi:GNAT family N-acetyltransferase [Pedobacter ginsengisoli]|uniref:GNAT family N-acetyltransferase n=1 Tax=Pedobacter ginsengisoli TaxID=363852 RepID=A0A2D1U3T9_9SPHI|nr:GNAT family N-acetyltransferase [Pedobacter ginsengisoli]ATP56194.1 GNAT family N-acetyltransferase [Pedobacter ginsengisoli]
MSTSILIEPIYNNYCARIIDIILPIQQIEFGVPITLEGQPDLLDIETNYHKDGGGFWGALNNEELVGTIALMNVGHNAGVIRKMFVKKAYRGKELNIAQHLLESLIDYCRQNNITDIYLGTVDILKAACRFYERNAFVKIDMEELPSYFPRMKADNTFYHLNLNVPSL